MVGRASPSWSLTVEGHSVVTMCRSLRGPGGPPHFVAVVSKAAVHVRVLVGGGGPFSFLVGAFLGVGWPCVGTSLSC